MSRQLVETKLAGEWTISLVANSKLPSPKAALKRGTALRLAVACGCWMAAHGWLDRQFVGNGVVLKLQMAFWQSEEAYKLIFTAEFWNCHNRRAD